MFDCGLLDRCLEVRESAVCATTCRRPTIQRASTRINSHPGRCRRPLLGPRNFPVQPRAPSPCGQLCLVLCGHGCVSASKPAPQRRRAATPACPWEAGRPWQVAFQAEAVPRRRDGRRSRDVHFIVIARLVHQGPQFFRPLRGRWGFTYAAGKGPLYIYGEFRQVRRRAEPMAPDARDAAVVWVPCIAHATKAPQLGSGIHNAACSKSNELISCFEIMNPSDKVI